MSNYAKFFEKTRFASLGLLRFADSDLSVSLGCRLVQVKHAYRLNSILVLSDEVDARPESATGTTNSARCFYLPLRLLVAVFVSMDSV